MDVDHRFSSRWLIRGRLVLRSPLSLRSGETEMRELPGATEDDGAAPEVALLQRAANGLPMIPGSSLKGAVRHWVESRLPQAGEAAVKQVFGGGPEPIDETDEVWASTGGKAEFHDAVAAWSAEPGSDGRPPPMPLRSSTAIDRHTRTAEHRKLFHGEQVPAGTTFAVEITGDGFSDGECDALLAALEGFNAGGDHLPLTLGGGGTSGKGRANWYLDEVRRMDVAAVARWLRLPEPCSWRRWILADPGCLEDAAALRERARLRWRSSGPPFVRLKLEIAFDGPLLVKDPSRTRPAAEGEGKEPDALPRLDEQGQLLLPGESVKGALRAQAERIARTIGLEPATAAGPAVQVFGNTEQRGLLEVEDFRRCDGRGLAVQQFVAIDRFTGGAAPGKLYLFEHGDRPVMAGALTLRLEREATQVGRDAIGLLALTLRDLIDGDITFGLGAAKGYGACRARIAGLHVGGGALPDALAGLPGMGAAQAAEWPVDGADLAALYGEMLAACVQALHDQTNGTEGSEGERAANGD